MNPKLIKALQFVIFLFLGLVLLYFAFRGIDLNELMLEIKHADYRWVALSLLFAVLALVFRAWRWRLLIEPLDEYPKVSHVFHAINIGYLANFVLPRIGEITRCGVLNRTDRIPVGRLIGTVIVERAFDLLMSALLLCLILLLRFSEVSDFITENMIQPASDKIQGGIGMGWLVAIIVLATLALILFFRIFRVQLSKISIMRKIKELMQGIVKGIKSAYRIRNFSLFVALNFMVFGMYFMQTYVMFFAIESTSSLGLGDALFILVLSTLAFIIPVQGAIGAYHWIISMGLTIFGLTRDEGMVYATISHTVTAILFILLGAMSLIFVWSLGRKTKTVSKPDS